MNKNDLINLIDIKNSLEKKLYSLIYGSIEVRSKNNKKYIYVHYREDSILLTKYVGEYTDDLYNQILNNNNEKRVIYKQLRYIYKKLKEDNYIEVDMHDDVKFNIDLARKSLVDLIYKQAILENINTTYIDIQTLIEGGKINNLSATEVVKIVNLKHAWDFILNKYVIVSKTNYNLLIEINKLVEEGLYYNAGKIRSVNVTISGSSYKPTIPFIADAIEDIDNIISLDLSDVDIAIELILYVMKKQIFIDGNKRTAIIFGNHYLISKGKGLLVVSILHIEEFRKLLIMYYEGNDDKSIKVFLKDKCFTPIK